MALNDPLLGTGGHVSTGLEIHWLPNVTAATSGEPSRQEWEDQRDRILDLYAQNQLPKVMAVMARDFNFRASKKAFRDHLRTWGGNNKHLGEDVIHTIVRKRKQRQGQGKASEFRLRGRTIAADQVDRNIKRRKKYTDEHLARLADSGPPTPEGLEVWTPPSTPPSSVPSNLTPTIFKIPERLLVSVRNFITSSISDDYRYEAGIWTPPWVAIGKETEISRTAQCDGLDADLHIFLPHAQAHKVAFGDQLNKVVEYAKSIIVSSAPHQLGQLLRKLLSLQDTFTHGVLIQTVNYVAHLSIQVLGAAHPFSVFCYLLSMLDANEIAQGLQQAWRLLTDESARFGETNNWYLAASMQYQHFTAPGNGVAFSRSLLARCNERMLPHDPSILIALSSIGMGLFEMGDYVGAERTQRDRLSRAQRITSPSQRAEVCFNGYGWVANYRYYLGDRAMAVNSLWMSVHALSGTPSRHNNGRIAESLSKLLRWQEEWGELAAAEEPRRGMVSAQVRKRSGRCSDLIRCDEPGCTDPVNEW